MSFASQILRTLAAADERTLLRLVRKSLGELRVALCFHRVSERRDKLAMPGAEIEQLIRFLLASRPGQERWLTVSFDDGFGEAAEYVLARAPRYPEIEWLYFLCPEKTERGEAELAPVEVCRSIQRLPNAALGNHTNQHQRLTALTPELIGAELAGSQRDFQRLFGEQKHFAIPYGVPGVDFSREHVEALRSLSDSLLWSTEPRPFRARERSPGAVLPRFAVDGRRSWKETAVHIALHALRARVSFSGEARP